MSTDRSASFTLMIRPSIPSTRLSLGVAASTAVCKALSETRNSAKTSFCFSIVSLRSLSSS